MAAQEQRTPIRDEKVIRRGNRNIPLLCALAVILEI